MSSLHPATIHDVVYYSEEPGITPGYRRWLLSQAEWVKMHQNAGPYKIDNVITYDNNNCLVHHRTYYCADELPDAKKTQEIPLPKNGDDGEDDDTTNEPVQIIRV